MIASTESSVAIRLASCHSGYPSLRFVCRRAAVFLGSSDAHLSQAIEVLFRGIRRAVSKLSDLGVGSRRGNAEDDIVDATKRVCPRLPPALRIAGCGSQIELSHTYLSATTLNIYLNLVPQGRY